MKTFFGGLFYGLGILIAGLSGLCCVLLGGSELMSPSANGPDRYDMLPLVLVFGGIPFGIGLAMFFIGRAMIRSGRTVEGAIVSNRPVTPSPPQEPDGHE